MGLDVYAVRPETTNRDYDEGLDALFKDVPEMSGGMFAPGGCISYFRGTSYHRYVEATTGVSLYSEYLSPATVKQMAEDLEDAADRAVALAQWFKVCAENGLAVHGSF